MQHVPLPPQVSSVEQLAMVWHALPRVVLAVQVVPTRFPLQHETALVTLFVVSTKQVQVGEAQSLDSQSELLMHWIALTTTLQRLLTQTLPGEQSTSLLQAQFRSFWQTVSLHLTGFETPATRTGQQSLSFVQRFAMDDVLMQPWRQAPSEQIPPSAQGEPAPRLVQSPALIANWQL